MSEQQSSTGQTVSVQNFHTKRAPKLTDEEKKVAWAWASWVAGCIRDSLEEVEIERIDDDGFISIVTEVLNDIAQSNALAGGDGR